METKIFLVVLDFNKTRSKFDPGDELNSEIAVDYFEDCLSLRETMLKLFPNKIIDLSLTTYLMKASMTAEEIKDMIARNVSDYFRKDPDNTIRQVFIASINDIKAFAPAIKRSEIDYIINAVF